MRFIASASLAVVALLAVEPATPTAAGSEPLVDHLVVIAPASIDGGWDQTARAMRSALLRSGLVGDVEVRNSPGAGGAVGLAQFVTGERGNGAALLIGGQVMLGAARTTHAAVSIADTTPIARLTGDYEVIAVPAGSELHDLDDLVQALRVQPGAVAWAGGSIGGSDQLLVSTFARAIGVDPVRMDYVPFTGGGEVAEALIKHEVAAGVSGYGEFAQHVTAGRVHPLGIAAERRLPGLDVPTLREQGVDITLVNWRGVFAPPGITDEQRARLGSVIAAMVRTPGWGEALARHRWSDLYLPDAAFARFVENERVRAAALPDPRGTRPAQEPGAVWTGEMRMLRNRRVLGGLVLAAALAAAGLIAWQRASADQREHELFKNLEAARQDASLRGAETESLLRGLSEQIDRQFAAWGLTAAEREVALLMLKGLRHKEIASVRATSERTVRQQALTIYRKAGLDGRTDLAAFFLEDLLQPGSLGASGPVSARPKRFA
jgi:putative tricarboxylic transport membrane protein